MQVFKKQQPLVAFKFVANGKGNNFDALSADVTANGGTAELIGDNLVAIRGVGTDVTLPIGFAVVFSGGIGKIINVNSFDTEYEELSDAPFDLDGLVVRVEKLEKALKSKATKSTGTTDSKTSD